MEGLPQSGTRTTREKDMILVSILLSGTLVLAVGGIIMAAASIVEGRGLTAGSIGAFKAAAMVGATTLAVYKLLGYKLLAY